MGIEPLLWIGALATLLTACDAWRLSGLSNCAIEALKSWWASPDVRIRVVRNKRGQLHVQWTEHGQVWEYYAKGASQFGFFKRLAYRGRVVMVGREKKG